MCAPLTSAPQFGSMVPVKALRFIFWLAWFLVAFVSFLVLLQYGPAQFTQGAGDLFAEAKGWAGLSR